MQCRHGAVKYKRALQSVQKIALVRMVRAYRTPSWQALCVVGGVPPIHLLMEERTRNYKEGQSALQKLRTAATWQAEWSANLDSGQWTKRLIPQLKDWVGRPHGEITYATTQMLTVHGCFRNYLFRFKRSDNPDCTYCGQLDDAEHTFFKCPRWAEVRCRVVTEVDAELSPENVATLMLKSEENWRCMSERWCEIIGTKEKKERKVNTS